MFERFTEEARAVVVGAQQEARSMSSGHIGTEHLLLALIEAGGPAAGVLRDHGVRAADLRPRAAGPLDAEALRALGIDLDAVREATERTFGEGALDAPAGGSRKGHIPFTREAKKALELSLRHAIRLKQKTIGDGHVLLGLLHDRDGTPPRLLAGAGADPDAVAADMTRQLTSRAA